MTSLEQSQCERAGWLHLTYRQSKAEAAIPTAPVVSSGGAAYAIMSTDEDALDAGDARLR
jgi:hypothetical protein